jgi:hypothetical protein
LTFLEPSGVFQPVTLMGFWVLSECPGKEQPVPMAEATGAVQPQWRVRPRWSQEAAEATPRPERPGEPGRVDIFAKKGISTKSPALKPAAVAADTTGVPNRWSGTEPDEPKLDGAVPTPPGEARGPPLACEPTSETASAVPEPKGSRRRTDRRCQQRELTYVCCQ